MEQDEVEKTLNEVLKDLREANSNRLSGRPEFTVVQKRNYANATLFKKPLDKKQVLCYKCHKLGHFASECRSQKCPVNSCKGECNKKSAKSTKRQEPEKQDSDLVDSPKPKVWFQAKQTCYRPKTKYQ